MKLGSRILTKDRCSFVDAPNSRERLNISQEMCLLLMTYHQVMPSFMDFMVSYGRHQYNQDFHFSGFRHESCLASSDRGLAIPELGRSGRRLQLCYNFRSVETSPRQVKWPWSIRQTAAYHCFDLENGQCSWIVVKGDQLIKNRVMSATTSPHLTDLRSFGSLQDSFSSALSTHLLLCDWSAENWRWYVNFLEEQVQRITRKTVDVAVSRPRDPIAALAPFSSTTQDPFYIKPRARTFTFTRKNSHPHRSIPSANPAPHVAPPGPPEPPEQPPEPIEDMVEDDHEGFSFGDLQRIQFIEEQANETLLILKTNGSVLTELSEYYCSVMRSEDCPPELQEHSKDRFARFDSRIGSIQYDLRMEQARVEILLRLLADRKTLVGSSFLVNIAQTY